MAEIKMQDVFRKLRTRTEVLTEEETKALFTHLDSLATRISRLEQMRAEAFSEGAARQNTKAKKSAKSKSQDAQREKQAILQEYGMLYEALQHTQPTNIEDGEEHQIYLNRIAALAADAAFLYEQGVAIGSPLCLNEDDEEEEADREVADSWSEVLQTSLLSNETILVLTCNTHEAQQRAKASVGAVLEGIRKGEFNKVPLPQEVIAMEGIIPWSEKPSLAFFHFLLESMGIDTIQEALQQAVEEHPGEGIFRQIAGSDFLGSVLTRIKSPSIADIYGSPTKHNSIEQVLAFLGGGGTQSELRRLELPRNLLEEDRFLLLAALLNIRIGTKITTEYFEHGRVWLWLDQLENILHYTQKEQRTFLHGITTIVTCMPRMLTLCMNISDPEPSTQKKVLQSLGPQFMQYVTVSLVGMDDSAE